MAALPSCPNCGKPIRIWAKDQGEIPDWMIAELLCDTKKCRDMAVAFIRERLIENVIMSNSMNRSRK